MPRFNTLHVRVAASSLLVMAALAAYIPSTASAQTVLGGSGNPGTTNTSGTVLGGNGNPSAANTADTSSSNCGSTGGQTIQNPLKVCSLTDLLTLVLKGVVQIGTIALTLAIIWVGFLFVSAQGNAEKISAARSALVWTIIGGLILLGAQAIGLVVQSTVSSL